MYVCDRLSIQLLDGRKTFIGRCKAAVFKLLLMRYTISFKEIIFVETLNNTKLKRSWRFAENILTHGNYNKCSFY